MRVGSISVQTVRVLTDRIVPEFRGATSAQW